MLSRDGQHILVDTGMRPCWRALQRRLERLGVRRIARLVLTHAHFDHASNAARVKEKYGAAVILHSSEAQCLASGQSPLALGTGWFSRPLARLVGARYPRVLRYPPCQADVLIGDQYDLTDLGFEAYLLHTPGHSPGSISLIIGREIALVGDALFGVRPRSVFPPFATDEAELIRSWEKLLEIGCRLFLPAHGRPRDRKLLEKSLSRHRRVS